MLDVPVLVAEVVSSAAIRESFFGVATSYTLDEVIKLSSLLKEDHKAMSLEDSREAAQLDLNRLLRDGESANRDQVINAAAAEILQKRSARRDARAKRAERMATEVRSESEAQALEAERRAEKAETEKAEVQRELDRLRSAGDGEAGRLKRLVRAAVIGAVFSIALMSLLASGVIAGWSTLIALLGTAWFAVAAVKYVTTDASGLQLIVSSVGETLAVVLAWALGAHH